jgi:hypothetical protein
MSVKWMAKMWESDLKGAELLMAIAIADHADHDGFCFPGLESLAAKLKLKKRQVQDLIDRLEKKGIVKMTRGKGRGHKTVFQFQKVQDSAPITPPEKVQESARKGAVSCKEKVQFSASPYIEEPLRESDMKREDEEPAASDFGKAERSPSPESLFHHPVIASLRTVTGFCPKKDSWALLASRVEGEVDVGRLAAVYAEWVGSGNKATNFVGILDWYLGERRFGNGSGKKSNHDGYATHDERVKAESIEFYNNYSA